MTNDFIIMLAAGAFAGLMAFLIRHSARKLLRLEVPKWIMPAAAGLAMLGITIWGEYNWYAAARDGLPEGTVVLQTNSESMPWRPWSYIWPVTNRFVALDTANRAKPAPDVVVANLYLVARWRPVQPVTVAYECTGHRQAILGGEAAVNADGSLSAGEWLPAPMPDAGLNAACTGG
ncbi:hypothetical protein C8J27_101679 [Rhodobacter aestuarii]|uniref:Uncharacterized protein n=1 Tax=Rhodobacter aestuarii TaxID=453582 RepID=A0A1N7P3V7_9RHOB|nr:MULTISPECIES: hypothetical protein [Rhodobacter]PTV97563.1 hypothetical protein C8J27_101679 [Rhodobacter aestuarii]SIT05315.1 hypothetical protein SAMN05421580_10939 [Rhodobacter aestuarii]SOC05101.1 hypothetical protein SAMN05877809_103384 [Rhodobacter sp. JA431]